MNKIAKLTDRAETEFFAAQTQLSTDAWTSGKPDAFALAPFVDLFQSVDTLRTSEQPLILQFVGTMANEGTSTVVAGFAWAAQFHYGKSALIVDCASPTSPNSRPGLIDALRRDGTLAAAIEHDRSGLRVDRAHLVNAPRTVSDSRDAELRDLFALLRQTYAIVALDCSPVTTPQPSLALPRLCDGTILVVRAETTSRKMVKAAAKTLARLGGIVIGTVLNRQPEGFSR